MVAGFEHTPLVMPSATTVRTLKVDSYNCYSTVALAPTILQGQAWQLSFISLVVVSSGLLTSFLVLES